MYKIYYDYAEDDIRSDAYRELDKVVSYMKRNPSVKLRLVSHADARGSQGANEGLSRRRSQSAYTYLTRHGIDKNRLEQVWLGERKPVNDCIDGVDCTEDQYQENRRTEIQYGGKLKENELPKPKVEETPVMEEAPMMEETGKDAIKEEAEPSGKDLIKETAPESGKEAIKESVEDTMIEELKKEEGMIQDFDAPQDSVSGGGE
jgi:hypothetical protein